MFANPIARTSCAIAVALALAVAMRAGGATNERNGLLSAKQAAALILDEAEGGETQ